MNKNFAKWLGDDRVIAIVRNPSADSACETARALIAGGIRLLEFSMTTEAALESLERTAHEFRGKALVGAGTVLTLDDATQAVDAGAAFLVSPVLLPELLEWSKARELPAIPGAMTPNEVWHAHEAGAEYIKIFPAGALGPQYIRDLLGPLPALQLVPTGGVDLTNSLDYLRAGARAVALSTALTAPTTSAGLSRRATDLLAQLRAVGGAPARVGLSDLRCKSCCPFC